MKCITKLTLQCLLIILATQSFAQKKEVKAPNEDFLVIQGRVTDNGPRVKGVTVRLFKGNSKIDSVYTGKNGEFQFSLGKDYFYTIELSKFGFENTCVLINSSRWDVDPQNEDKRYQVDFEVELIPEIENKKNLSLSEQYLDVIDFPKVIIGYMSGEDEGFYSDKKYMKYVKESLKKIKDTAKTK
jgi:hypothetical protein